MSDVMVLFESEEVIIPEWVVDLKSFRQWAHSEDLPEKGKVGFLGGQVWVDMSQEQIFSHLLVKTQFTVVLGGLVAEQRMGLFLADGLLLSNAGANMAGNPDATFISKKSLEKEAVRFLEGKRGGFVEIEGSPDMVLEVVSHSSVRKDTVLLRKAYWEAGVREYWLVDARKEPLSFEILRHTPKGYVATRHKEGWLKSAVFEKAFRLTQRQNDLGHPEYTLSLR
jgi:Uma2 family endonuclease